MANGNGGRRPGAGRKKGSRNKHPAGFRASLRAYCDEIGVDPHQFMADMIADPAVENPLKLHAAKELAQYMEPKLKAVEHTGEIGVAHRFVEVTLE